LTEAHKFLDRALLNDILDFPQRCMMANSSGNYYYEHGADNTFRDHIRTQSIRLGILAMSIGKRLREEYKLAPRELKFGKFEVENYLKDRVG